MEPNSPAVGEARQSLPRPRAGDIVTASLGGALRAAAGEVDITPCGAVSYRGYPLSECEVRHRLRAKLLLVGDGRAEALWISADECSFRRAPADRIKQRLLQATGIAPVHILLAGTHAHSTHHYTSFQADLFAALVGEAIPALRRALRPVGGMVERIGTAPQGSIVNRRISLGRLGEMCVMFNDRCAIDMQNARVDASDQVHDFLASLGTTPEREGVAAGGHFLDGPTDDRLHLWTLLDNARAPIASVFRVNAHAVSVSQSRVGAIVSADYIRYLEECVKDDCQGAPCLTLNGAFGDTRPLQSGYNFDEAERIGRAWARAAIAAPAQTYDVAQLFVADAPAVRLPIRPDVPHGAEALRLLDRRMQDAAQPADALARKRHAELLACVRALLTPEPPQGTGALRAGELDRGFLDCEWQAWQFGPLRLLCLPGEPFVRLCRRLEAVTGCLPIGIANGYISYLPNPESIAQGGYEATESLLDAAAIRGLTAVARRVAGGLRPRGAA